MEIEYIDSEYQELIPGFMENKRKEVDSIRSLCVQKDFGKLAFMGHRIKGSAENYGFRYIADFGRLLEFYAGAEDLGAIEGMLNSLVAYLDTVEIQYVDL